MISRVAAIDCGTNSIRLLIADIDPDTGVLTDVDRRMEIVRLGQGVDRTGELAADALERTFAACAVYGRIIDAAGAPPVRFVATSASRDARNRDVFVDGVRSRLGVEPEVISGQEEAALSFLGATADLGAGAAPPQAPLLVVDIGGGSTEFVLGTDQPEASISTDIGCVRLTERHLHDDPPTPEQILAVTSDIDAAIDRAATAVPLAPARSLVGLAGSVTTVAALALGLRTYDPDRIHGSRISADQVARISDTLLAQSRAERAAEPVMHPGRVDVIAAGALILRRILERTGLPEVVVSEHDILDGIARSLLAR